VSATVLRGFPETFDVPDWQTDLFSGKASSADLGFLQSPETFRLSRGHRSITRIVTRRDGSTYESIFRLPKGFAGVADHFSLAKAADAAFLRIANDQAPRLKPELRVVDLFSGCGAMSLGLREACRALGLRFRPVGAFDVNQRALSVYEANFGGPVFNVDLSCVLSPSIHSPITSSEKMLRRSLGRADFVIAGPPCQGHSNLNNWTRRNDPKNDLYFLVARFAKVCAPRWVVIENVMSVRNDKNRVVDRTKKALEVLGYEVSEGVADLWTLGVPQTRRRHVLIARKRISRQTTQVESVETMLSRYRVPTRDVMWAIGDISRPQKDMFMDRQTLLAPITKKRIDFLFDNNLYDLPDSKRPDCHRLKQHRYQSVYGRMRPNQPAPTITGGFDTMGRGRFVHPTRRRTITPHEAARIQFLPDHFDFSPVFGQKRTLVELIGNAVPPKLSYALCLDLLR
jgi:DNA (cytosine-5)-methyltransferase 1